MFSGRRGSAIAMLAALAGASLLSACSSGSVTSGADGPTDRGGTFAPPATDAGLSETEAVPSELPPTTSEATSPSGFAVDGSVVFIAGDGYTMTVSVTWTADAPMTDVGSEPPGKTDIVIDRHDLHGVLTNTTEGGRSIPAGRIPSLALAAIYPSSSLVCQQQLPDANVFDYIAGGHRQHVSAGPTTCAVLLEDVFGQGAGGGPLNLQSPIPNLQPVSYDLGDLADTDVTTSGPVWGPEDEATADAMAAALASPIAMGIYITFGGDYSGTGTPTLNSPIGTCTYGSTTLALIASNFGTTPITCP
jgi:hypothetical protein